MTSAEVLAVVRDQVGPAWNRTDWPHGVLLERDAIDPPAKATVHVAWDPDEQRDVWVVLEEPSDDHAGYRIVYCEQEDAFGLATPIEPGLLLLGFYGDFVTTLECM